MMFKEPPHCSDVSGWQDPDELDCDQAYEDGCILIVVKRAQGCGKTKSGDIHAANIAESPISRADYHFGDTKKERNRLEPERQAETFCKAVGELQPGDGIPWLDLEWHSFGDSDEGRRRKQEYYDDFSRRDNTDWALAWLDYVEARLGIRPGIYTMASYARHRLSHDLELLKSPLWLANGGRKRKPKLDPRQVPTTELIEAGWKASKIPTHLNVWDLYQWTGGGRVDWYRKGKGKIDRNVFRNGLITFGSLLCS